MVPETKPKILDNIYNKNGEIIGKVGGIILNSSNIDKNRFLEKLISSIEKIKEDDIDSIIIEDISLLNNNDIGLIQTKINLKVVDGRKVLAFFLPLVLNKVYKRLGEDLKTKEILIIADEEELTIEIIKAIHREVRFVTLIGDDENDIKNITKNILDNTGLSLFCSKNIDKILTNYSIIINLNDNICFDIDKVGKEAIIFDLSIGKKICNIIKSRRGPVVVDDFIFNTQIENKWIERLVSSHVYECFYEFKPRDLKGLLIDKKICSIEEFVDYKMRNKGKL
jgi:hypothetical protein